MLQEKAQANIRKIRAWNLVTSGFPILLVAVSMILMLADILTSLQAILLYVVAGLFWRIAVRVVMAREWKKYVYNVMDEELDAPLFIEILREVGKYDPFAIHQLQLLYAEGRHADVVSLCTKQMDNPYAKRCKPGYLTYMAFAYFSLGDDQRLAEIHEATEWFLQSQKNPEKYRRLMPMQVFYAAYLKRDTDACEAYFAATPPKVRIAAVQRYLLRARVAQLKGDTEAAERFLRQVLTEGPNTPAALTAKAHLAAIERGEGYDKAFPEALPDPLFPVVTSQKRHRTVKILIRVCIIVSAALLVYSGVLHSINERRDSALREEVRVAMETEYDGVSVLECFSVSDGESWVETLALCSTDGGLVLASPYYRGDSEELLCYPVAVFIEEDFAENGLPSRVFAGYTADYYGLCAFYASEKEIPEDRYVSFPVTVYGQKLWFAVKAEPPRV